MNTAAEVGRTPKETGRIPGSRLVVIGALVVLALWIRFRVLGYADMWWDQSITLNRSLEWLHGGSLPLSSMWSTFDVFNPPLVQYLYAVPLLFRESILGVVVFVGAANLLGVLSMAVAAARVFGWRTGWWAALLMVVCPWAAFYGRFVWMQTFVPAFSSMLLAFLLLYFADTPKPVYLIASGVCLAAVIQSHMISVALLPVLVLVAILYFKRLRPEPLLIAAALFALTFLPYLLFQIQTGFRDWHRLLSALTGGGTADLQSVHFVATLLGSEGAYPAPAVDLALTLGDLDLRWLPVDGLTLVLVAAGAAQAAILATRTWRREGRAAAAGPLILVLWLLVPPLVLIRHSHPLAHWYLLQVFPAPFVLVALLADQCYVAISRWLQARSAPFWQRWGSTLGLIAFLPLAVVAVFQLRVNVIGQNLRAEGEQGKFRMADVQEAIDGANELVADRPDCQLVVISEVAIYESSRFGLLREFVGRDRVRFSQAGATYLYPSPCAVYFQGTMSLESKAWLESIARPIPDQTITTAHETWGFYELGEEARAAAVTALQLDEPAQEWPNGIGLYQAEYEEVVDGESQAGLPSSLVVTTTWAIGQGYEPDPLPVYRPTNPDDYMLEGDGKWSRRIHTGHYLLSEDMALISQFDTVGLDSREWKPGDVFRVVVRVPIPEDLTPGRYCLAVALYWYPAVEKLPLPNSDLDIATIARIDWSARVE
jgi:4-amino-4-deoxy-L-arabinose transferase-like glycosyltransferase